MHRCGCRVRVWVRGHDDVQVHKPVPVIQVRPLGCFIHIFITTPIVPTLKNYYVWSFLEVPTDFFNHFWIQVADCASEVSDEWSCT